MASWYGITAAWASEIESAPVSITKGHFPNMKHLGDITKINGAVIDPVDIITFGSPCQDLSVAGKRAGLAGARSGLFGEAIRIIEEMRESTNGLYPTWAIWENVPGALSSNNGLDFRAVLQSFADTEIPMPTSGRWGDAGMVRGGKCDFGWRILDAQFWGVPQRRKRVFVIADFRGKRAAEVLFKSEGVRGHFTPSRTEGEGVAADAESGTVYPIITPTPGTCTDKSKQFVYDCRGNGDGVTVNTLIGDHQNRVTDYTAICVEPIIYNEEAVTSKTNGSNPKQGDACHTLGASGAGRALLINTAFCIAANTIDRQPQNGGNGLGCQEELSYTLTSMDRYAVAFGFKSFGEYEQTEIGKSLLANDDITTGDLIADFRKGKTVRRLTPKECERLQGYPDEWTRYGHDGKEISDSARYKACGNSLALPCVEYFISGILELSALHRPTA